MPFPKSTAGFLALQDPRWLRSSTALCDGGQGEGRDSAAAGTTGHVRLCLTLGPWPGQDRMEQHPPRQFRSQPGHLQPNQTEPTRQRAEPSACCLYTARSLHLSQQTGRRWSSSFPFVLNKEQESLSTLLPADSLSGHSAALEGRDAAPALTASCYSLCLRSMQGAGGTLPPPETTSRFPSQADTG